MSQDVFNQIAPGWYNFRHWSIFRRELASLARRWQTGRLLNAGCAHGADFLPFKDNFELHGVDFAPEMLRFAQKYAQKYDLEANLAVADVSHLPYPSQTFDWAISIATYHHLKYREARLAAMQELWRVLKPNGEAFVTVWNHGQPRFWLKPKEVAIPWRTRDKTLYRYYYLFSYPEFARLARQAGFKILKSYPEHSYRFPVKFFSRNICLLLKKVK